MYNNSLINGNNYEVPDIINITKVFLNNSETKKKDIETALIIVLY